MDVLVDFKPAWGQPEATKVSALWGSMIRCSAFDGLEVLGSGKSMLSGLSRVHGTELETLLEYDSGNDGKVYYSTFRLHGVKPVQMPTDSYGEANWLMFQKILLGLLMGAASRLDTDLKFWTIQR